MEVIARRAKGIIAVKAINRREKFMEENAPKKLKKDRENNSVKADKSGKKRIENDEDDEKVVEEVDITSQFLLR